MFYDIMDNISFGDYNAKINDLATLSPEQWSFKNANDNSILKNYLKYTFNKLCEENKFIEEKNYAIFNTGLFTDYYEQIYAYLEPNKKREQKKWYLKQFGTEYDMGNYNINELPDRANYFEKPELLVFDAKCKININFKHILNDSENVERLPESIRNRPTLASDLSGAIEITKKKVVANYKIAVPQYFNGTIQLLLPLYLLGNNAPDLALVVNKSKNGLNYGHGI